MISIKLKEELISAKFSHCKIIYCLVNFASIKQLLKIRELFAIIKPNQHLYERNPQ